MILKPTKLAGAYLIEPERRSDERGFFARTWCKREFEELGLNTDIVQCNNSFSPQRGTVRGLHYQRTPHAETKLVRCIRGAIYDVVVDMRPDSKTCGRWEAFQLNAENRRMLYVPEGLAHGFMTLADDSEVLYQVSQYYSPEYEAGLRWDDPAIAIHWPGPARLISARDLAFPDWSPKPNRTTRRAA